jgi:hypothetical protein
MFTTGSKWFFGLSLYAFLVAVVYGFTTGGDRIGPLTLGWYGAVGELAGYGLLLAISAVTFVLGVVSLATRDADPDAVAHVAGTEIAPAAVPPAAGAYWPAVGGLAAGMILVGVVTEPALFVAGLILLGVVVLEWAVQAWSDRATGDPATNRAVRDQLMRPLEFPIGGAAFAILFVFGLSRMFLTLSKTGAVAVAGTFAALVLLVGALLATRSRVRAGIVTVVVVLAGLGVLTAGVISAARGARTFEHHEAEHESENEPILTPAEGIGGEPEADGSSSGTETPAAGTEEESE